jgi:hypothetical protein
MRLLSAAAFLFAQLTGQNSATKWLHLFKFSDYNKCNDLVCVTGVNVDNHEGAHISYAVRLGKVFGL